MSNIHGLSSFNNNSSDDDNNSDENNNRYVGGVSARGGGSGLAVEPNTNDNDILNRIRANAEEGQPSSSSPPSGSANTRRRMITMYRSGFTIDDGSFRRLDDPSNAEFLRDLARGVTPRELYEGSNEDGSARGVGNMEVGLVDKRNMEYEDDQNRGGAGGSAAAATATPAAFSGAGQSLGSSVTSSSEGVITPSSDTKTAPTADESKPQTTIQIRLLNGKRLIVKCNLDDTVQTLVLHIEASGSAGEDNYVLRGGYPPKVLTDLNKSIEESGLKGAQVIQKKA
jgi:UBX domain-containing protein 1